MAYKNRASAEEPQMKFVNSDSTVAKLHETYLPTFILTDFSYFHLQVIDEWEKGFPKIDEKATDTARLEKLLEAHHQPQHVHYHFV